MDECEIRIYDSTPFEITLELTSNQRRLIYDLLQQIPVEPRHLSYQCARSIMVQIYEKLQQKNQVI